MTIPTHLVAGLMVGKLTGDYSFALVGALGPDVDHLVSYAKNGVLLNPKEFWKTITNTSDPYGDQRYYLHNVLVFVSISAFVYYFNSQIGIALGLAYLSHLILDALDDADYFPFFPNKKIVIKGPVGYFSKEELIFFLVLACAFFWYNI